MDDPGGTPLSDKCTFADVRTLLQANLTAAVITVAAANTSALVSTGYSLTGADATSMIDLAGTWNTSGAPTALKLNVTDTASNAASLLMDLQVNSASVFKVSHTSGSGVLFFAGTEIRTAGAGGKVRFNTQNITGRYSFETNYAVGATIISGGSFGWSNSTTAADGGNLTLALYRDADNTLGQRNGTNAQAFRVYNTFTDASNGSWMTLDAAKTTANVNRIISNANGTGTIRPIVIDAYAMSGAPTTSELPSGTWGVFKDSSGGSPGNVVIAYNDEGNILTASLA